MNNILIEINKIILEEGGKELTESSLLSNSELDSFGYTILFFTLDEIYNCTSSSYVNNIDFKTYKVLDLINWIKEHEIHNQKNS